MKKTGLIEIIFLMGSIASMLFSKNIPIRIISAILLLVYIVVSKLLIYYKRKKFINEINDKEKIYMSCKENNYIFFLMAFAFILNSITNITDIVNNKTTDIFINSGNELNRFVGFISKITVDEKVSIFINIILIILAFVFVIEGLISFAIISDDKILFYNGIIFNFSEITGIKYREPLISSRKIIKLRKNYYEQEIILKLEDFEKVRKYLEDSIAI